jgi:hypothetical protein
MPREEFNFSRIFEELFVFVIDSPVYSPPRSRDKPMYSSPGSRLPSDEYTGESQPKLVCKNTSWYKVHQVVKTPLLTRWFIHFFIINIYDPCLNYEHQEKSTPVYSSQGSRDCPVYSPPGESRLAGVFVTGESFLDTGESFYLN